MNLTTPIVTSRKPTERLGDVNGGESTVYDEVRYLSWHFAQTHPRGCCLPEVGPSQLVDRLGDSCAGA
jgi:hypothetical protein